MSSFSTLPIPAPLADAITARGYETATSVQVAVLEERCNGHDLLVSSQTGSGKTLAFGVLLAQALLEEKPDAPAAAPGKRTRKTTALIIAPTRELANQVRSELAWLFEKTRLQVVAFTGGSDVRRDMKTLSRGVDLVVGTPGRLVDLLQRQALVLDSVEVAVLDEADEMLDMGFRDDLETLLGAASARKRTHMFSATLPRPILQLASRYQGEAVRVDAREEGASGAHTDIEYVAHVVGYDDRLAAVVNILRMHADQKAIVFGTTREGVANLHQALLRHGFRAVVLSGDRAQGERNRAIEALKDNEAQVLVATNVAARGLDLPEVDLVLHADLPLNAESLTHRSGRTGRAGRKGQSVVIADPSERRKAERLLSMAKAKYVWTPAPTAEAIAEAGRRRLEEELLEATVPEDAEEARGLANRLLKDHKKEELLEVLLLRELARCPRGEPLRPVDPRYLARAPREMRDEPELPPRRSRADFERNAVAFRVNLGAADKAEPGWILPLICRRGGVTRNEVGAIRVGPTFTEFQIAGDAVQDFALAAARTDPRAPNVVIEASGPLHSRAGGYGKAPRPRDNSSYTKAPRPHADRDAPQAKAPRPRADHADQAGAQAKAPTPENQAVPQTKAPAPNDDHDVPQTKASQSQDNHDAPQKAPRPRADAAAPQLKAPQSHDDHADAADADHAAPQAKAPQPHDDHADAADASAPQAKAPQSPDDHVPPPAKAPRSHDEPAAPPAKAARSRKPDVPQAKAPRSRGEQFVPYPKSPQPRDGEYVPYPKAPRPPRDDRPAGPPRRSEGAGFQPPRRHEARGDASGRPSWQENARPYPPRPRAQASGPSYPSSPGHAPDRSHAGPRDERKHFENKFARKPRPAIGGKPAGAWKKPR